MPLVLEIEYLLGVAFAARNPASETPDWPPQPDRAFSALTAAWGARGESTEERHALEWLEAQDVPSIAYSDGFARTSATAYVPPNDPETKKLADRSILPAFRRRQPRRFPAYRPHDSIVRIIWSAVEPQSKMLDALNALAHDTAYVGHSSSLTRCRFLTEIPKEATTPLPAQRRIYPGRLERLIQAYSTGQRPPLGDSVQEQYDAPLASSHGTFSDRWLVLEYMERTETPDLRASALVANTLRHSLIAAYASSVSGHEIPAKISGRTADGQPTDTPHLAVVPLASLGWPHADSHVLGFAIIPPLSGKLLDDSSFKQAVRQLAPWNEERAQREIQITCGTFNLRLALSQENEQRSLDPSRYTATAKTWASATPILLDRHVKAKGAEAIEKATTELISQACRNIGLPAPQRVVTNKHSAINGAPSAYPSGNAPAWTGWHLPSTFAGRHLTHAIMQFEHPVRGPVLLGAGRFVGLGLCLPFDSPDSEM